MPKYYKLLKRYSRKGFGMLDVSLDNNYNKWVQATAEDSLHLSELQSGHGEDIRCFGSTGIPATILVDSAGRLVAVDISYPRLHNILQQGL